MSNLDASTPQLKVVKQWIESYITLDTNNTNPLLSKHFQFESYPRSSDIPDEPKKAHMETWGARLSTINKLEVVTHEVVEAPGKVVILGSAAFQAAGGSSMPYDFVNIITLVEEDGELKLLNCKNFADAGQRDAVLTWAAKAQAQGSADL